MKSKKMNVQLSVYIILIVLITVFISSILYYYRTSDIQFDENFKQTRLSIETSAEYIESYLVRLKGISDVIAMHPDTISFIEGDSRSKGAVKALMDLSLESDENILSISMVLRDGQLISSGSSEFLIQSEDMMDESWYMEAKDSHQMPALNSIRRTDFTMDKENWVISISREIVNDDNEHLGVLLIDLDYSFFEEYINNISLGDSGYAFVIENDGDVVYHPDTSYFENSSKNNELVAICELGEGSEKDGLITFKTSIGHSEWLLVGLSSLDSLNMLRVELLQTSLVVILLMLSLGILLAIIVSRRVTSPIHTLEKAMKEVSKTWASVDIKGEYKEVDSLIDQYNQMIAEIKSLLDQIRNNESKMRQYEFDALENQINPHFLYNTLDTIVWLSEFKEHEKAIYVTKALSNLLRVSLRSETLIPLEQELTHVENYLKIQKERYDTLNYSLEVEDAARQVMVPKIILQPIVENSIYHGIKEGSGKGTVKITATITDYLVIVVEDDGVGFDTHLKKKGKRIGLDNVDHRIKLLFGDEYGIKINSTINIGSKITFMLPK